MDDDFDVPPVEPEVCTPDGPPCPPCPEGVEAGWCADEDEQQDTDDCLRPDGKERFPGCSRNDNEEVGELPIECPDGSTVAPGEDCPEEEIAEEDEQENNDDSDPEPEPEPNGSAEVSNESEDSEDETEEISTEEE